MSNIIFDNINEEYPVAGINNNTQGFRDNFQAIKTALSLAKSEIAKLEATAILSESLTATQPAINDLNNNALDSLEW